MGLLRPDGPGAPSLDAAKWGTWGLGLPRPRPDKLGVPPPRRPSRPAGPRAAPKLPTRRRPVPAVPAPRTEQNLRRPDKSARGPGTPRELPAPPGACRDPAPRGTRTSSRGATRTPAWETEERPPRGLRSLTRQRVPEASATDRVPPTPTRTYRSWRRERPRVRHGAGLRGAQRPPTRARGGGGGASAGSGLPPATSGAPPRRSHFPAHSRPLRALTGLARPGPAQQSPPRRQLLDGAVAGDTSGATRAGQGRVASRRSREWRRRCAAE